MENESSNPDYSQRPRDKSELMARIEREWTALKRAIEPLGEEQMGIPDAGGWAIKDNLAHLAAWEQSLRLYHLGHTPAHEALQMDEATFKQLDEDGINAIILKRNRNRNIAEIKAELDRSHAQVLADLERFSYAELMQPRYADDPEARPIMDWVIGNTYEHYKEHRASIEKLANHIRG